MDYYEASGITYHCKYCGCTTTKEFLLGEIVLPLTETDIEQQNTLKKKFGSHDLLMHVENCICENCIPKLEDHERILSNSEIFSKKNKIIIKYKHESEVANEKIMKYYENALNDLLEKFDFSGFCKKNNIFFTPQALKKTNEVERVNLITTFVNQSFSQLKSLAFDSIDQAYPNEILSKSTAEGKKYYKEFKSLKNKDWTENEMYLKQCNPINSLHISEYLKVNENFDQNVLSCKESTDSIKMYEIQTINPITLGFPLSAFDAFNIFDVIINNIRFKDKLTEKLLEGLR